MRCVCNATIIRSHWKYWVNDILVVNWINIPFNSKYTNACRIVDLRNLDIFYCWRKVRSISNGLLLVKFIYSFETGTIFNLVFKSFLRMVKYFSGTNELRFNFFIYFKCWNLFKFYNLNLKAVSETYRNVIFFMAFVFLEVFYFWCFSFCFLRVLGIID